LRVFERDRRRSRQRVREFFIIVGELLAIAARVEDEIMKS
jgi:hypothetical protein